MEAQLNRVLLEERKAVDCIHRHIIAKGKCCKDWFTCERINKWGTVRNDSTKDIHIGQIRVSIMFDGAMEADDVEGVVFVVEIDK